MLKKFPLLSKEVNSVWITILLAVYFTFGLNFVLTAKIYKILSESEQLPLFFYASVPVLFLALFVIVFTPFVSKYIFKPFFIILILISASVNYAAYHFGIIFNEDMITNIFETASNEALSYLNLRLVIWFLLSAALPCFLVALVKVKYHTFGKEILKKTALIGGAILVVALIGALYYKDYASLGRNNPKLLKHLVPSYVIASTTKYINERFFTTPLPYQIIGGDAKRTNTKGKNLVVFIVGETARAKNYPVNGYERQTTAHTDQIKNVISFQNASSCGTATAVSVPCMSSMLGRKDYSREKFESQDNVVDILKRAGVQSVWLENNTGCKGVCRNIEFIALDKTPDAKCNGEDCHDDAFLPLLDKKISLFKGDDAIIYMHIMGSHGPSYYNRYPKDHAKFKPECLTSDLQKCTKDEIVNTYDNTLLFTDFVMAETIKTVKKYEKNYNISVIYVSDHGESLGENGIYLHGMPYSIAPDEQTHVPFMVWVSDQMIKNKGIDMKCLQQRAKAGNVSHDNISSTLLNMMDIKTEAYKAQLDLIGSCQKK